MEKIRETVDKLADLSSEKQTEGLQLLVQTFMDSMNEAVGDQFGQLQQVLATTIDSQGSIREGLEEFGNQLRQVGEVQQKLISDTNRDSRNPHQLVGSS